MLVFLRVVAVVAIFNTPNSTLAAFVVAVAVAVVVAVTVVVVFVVVVCVVFVVAVAVAVAVVAVVIVVAVVVVFGVAVAAVVVVVVMPWQGPSTHNPPPTTEYTETTKYYNAMSNHHPLNNVC